MRISDWSSDVCSSDLGDARPAGGGVWEADSGLSDAAGSAPGMDGWVEPGRDEAGLPALPTARRCGGEIGRASCKGQRVYVRVAHGGRRTKQQNIINTKIKRYKK